jgi:peptidyl-prolyl cis-trans isomerase D
MLSTMRRGVSSIFAKALLLFLVLTFGLWGVGDMIRHGRIPTVADIGSASISPQEFSERLARMKSQMSGMPAEMLSSPAFKTQILQGMVQQLLLLQEAGRIGITVDNTTIARVIRENPQFQTKNGTFDKARFSAFLEGNRINEAAFIDTIRHDIESATTLQTLDIPKSVRFETLGQMLDAAKKQKRSAEIYVIPPVALENSSVDNSELTKFYATIQRDYLQPEKRTIGLVTIDKAALSHYVASHISEEAITERYNSDKQTLGSPEKRDVVQFLFAQKEDAEKAASALKIGSEITSIERNFALKNKEALVMPAISKSALPQALSQAVFALKSGETTSPLKSDFGWHVFKVTHIIAPTIPAFATVHDAIKKTLSEEAEQDTLRSLSDKLEDAIAAGDTLEKATSQLGIVAKSVTLNAAETENTKGDSKTPEQYAVKKAFTLSEGELAPFEPFQQNYVAVTVSAIAPQAPKELEGIKQDVIKRYHEDARARASAARAASIATALRASEHPDAVASKEKLETRNVSSITLGEALAVKTDRAGVPAELLRRLFDVAQGEMTAPVSMSNGAWALAKVTSIERAAFTHSDAESHADAAPALTEALNNAVYANYLRHLTQIYPVHINESALGNDKETGNTAP